MSAPITLPERGAEPRQPRRGKRPALVLVKGNAVEPPIAEEVRSGLTATPKTLSPALFYDERGSQLFEAITQLPEYYLTRAEREIFLAHGDDIVRIASGGERLSMVELGAGTAAKTGILLEAAVRAQREVIYQPVDVSASALDEAVQALSANLPGVRVQPLVADYTEGYRNLPRPGGRRLALYIGSSIGNFEPRQAQGVLQQLRQELRSGDHLLLGTDLRKDEATLRGAYNDAAGVTAAFNRNVLERINRELGANFRLERFRHDARWNSAASRMEMHLVSQGAQSVEIPALDLTVVFADRESIHTENSYKFSRASVDRLLKASGYRAVEHWTDERGQFLVTLAAAV